MTTTLLVIIAMLLLFCAWQQRQHELWAERVIERFTPVPPQVRLLQRDGDAAYSGCGVSSMHTTGPRTLTTAEILGELEPVYPAEPVYPLVRRINSHFGTFDELAPTRRLRHPIHPRFEAYGVDVSVAPTIGIA